VTHHDVLIIGAGFSGIAAAYHLQRRCPDRSFAIFEGRDTLGGTWDLFRYPGIRSDSDMYTFGFSFRPWTGEKSIAEGAEILEYLRSAAKDLGIEPHIRLGHRVTAASWSTEDARWTVDVRHASGESSRSTCGFLIGCTGYYDYEEGYDPSFPGRDDFDGRIVHPQFWPSDLDCAGKRVVVIGSGATAVTLVPALARTAAHVTMLQRSPSYVVGRPAVDPVAHRIRKLFPPSLAHRLTRLKNIALHLYFYGLARRKPALVKAAIMDGVRKAVGPACDVDTHFNPAYDPWDQRLCFVPDDDLFNAIRDDRAEVVTDGIEAFSKTGVSLKSGCTIPADVIVTATGLKLQLLGGIPLTVDGAAVDAARSTTYRGMMYSGIPNLASIFGYTNAPFTLRADLALGYICDLLNTMRRKGVRQCVPVRDEPDGPTRPFIDMRSGYIERSLGAFPVQGGDDPWRVHQNHVRDVVSIKFGAKTRGLRFSGRG